MCEKAILTLINPSQYCTTLMCSKLQSATQLMLLSIRLLLSMLWGKLFLKEETMQAYLWHVNNQKQPSTGLCP